MQIKILSRSRTEIEMDVSNAIYVDYQAARWKLIQKQIINHEYTEISSFIKKQIYNALKSNITTKIIIIVQD